MRYPKTMRNTVLLLAAILLLASCGAERNFRRGEKYLALGEYFDAANEYRQSYQKTAPKERSRRGQIARKMGYCYAKGKQCIGYKTDARSFIDGYDNVMLHGAPETVLRSEQELQAFFTVDQK